MADTLSAKEANGGVTLHNTHKGGGAAAPFGVQSRKPPGLPLVLGQPALPLLLLRKREGVPVEVSAPSPAITIWPPFLEHPQTESRALPAGTDCGHCMSGGYGVLLAPLLTGTLGPIPQRLRGAEHPPQGASLSLPPSGQQNGATMELLASCDEGDGCYIQVPWPTESPMELPALSPEDGAKRERARVNSSEAKLLAKKRVIRMLVVIVALFFGCWLPIFVANTWQAFYPKAAQRALSGTPISFIHLLCYCSTCVNPFIYCFTNKRFRQAFATTFACRSMPCWSRPRRAPEEETTATRASFSKFSYTTVSSIAPPEH